MSNEFKLGIAVDIAAVRGAEKVAQTVNKQIEQATKTGSGIQAATKNVQGLDRQLQNMSRSLGGIGKLLNLGSFNQLGSQLKGMGQGAEELGGQLAQSGLLGGGKAAGGAAAGGSAAVALAAAAAALLAIVAVLMAIKAVIEQGIQSSAFAQGTIAAYQRTTNLILRPIGDVIGGVFYSLIRILMPLVRIWLMMWMPFQKQMMEGIKQVFEATDDPMQQMAGTNRVLMTTMANFWTIAQAVVVSTLVKALVDNAVKVAQVIVVVIGGGIVALLRALAFLISLFPGGGQGAAAVNAMADSVGTFAAELVGGLEVVNQAVQISADLYLRGLIEKMISTNAQAVELTASLSNWNTLLSGIASFFDKDFGTKVGAALDQVTTDADSLRASLAGLDFSQIDFTKLETAFGDMLGRMQKAVEGAAPTTSIVESIGGLAKPEKTSKDFFDFTEPYYPSEAMSAEDFMKSSQVSFENLKLEPLENAKLSIQSTVDLINSGFQAVQFDTGTMVGLTSQKWKGELMQPMQTTMGATATYIKGKVDEISKLLSQAKKDAAKISSMASDSKSSKKVSDAIISPGGGVITTDPADYLIATKTPGALFSGGSRGKGVQIDQINITVQGQPSTKELVREIGKQLQSELRSRLSYGVG
jgi:hypothetical protein